MRRDVREYGARGDAESAAGRYRRAKRWYLRAIAAAKDDAELAGTIYVSLGHAARRAGRRRQARRYYAKASSCLDKLKGEAILQSAHAQFNLAALHLDRDNRAALRHAEAALERYERYPFTPAVDVVDARILRLLASTFAGEPVDPDYESIWAAMKDVGYEDLTRLYVPAALTIVLAIMRRVEPSRYEQALSDVEAWADPFVAAEVRANVEGRPRPFDRRLQRALLGLPDEE